MSHFNVIKASAGSGKTFTLVQQYLSLAFSYPNEYGYQKVLAITFTNKAASEMKERVIHYLRGISEGTESDFYNQAMVDALMELTTMSANTLKTRAHDMLTHMIHHYNDIAISTIDKFVHKLIRSFSKDLNLNLDFEVEMDTDIHLADAIENMMTQVGIDQELTKYVIQFIDHQMNEKGKWQIKRELTEYSNRTLFDEKGAEAIKKLNNIPLGAFTHIIEGLATTLKQSDNQAKDIAKKCLDTVKQQGLDTADCHTHKLNFMRNVSKNGLIPLNNSSTSFLAEGTWTKTTVKEPTLSDHQSVTQPIAQELAVLYEDYPKHIALKALFKELYSTALLKKINEELLTIKTENNLLFISDFNSKISKLIKNEPAPFIYEKIGERFNHILIDEFQDTSTLQWENLVPLIENGLAKNKTSLIVGDGKQSIYRFRNGDVSQFAMLPSLKNKDNELLIKQREAILKQQYSLTNLAYNFRSSHHIILFNNWLIDQCKSKLQPENQNIYEQHEQKFLSEKPGYVCVTGIDRKEDKDGLFILSDLTQQIKSLHADGHRLNDMAILVRKNQEASIIAEHLMQEDIPVISQGSLRFSDSKKINLLIETLTFLLQPNNTFIAQALSVSYCSMYEVTLSNFMAEAFPNKHNNDLVQVLNQQLTTNLPQHITSFSLYEIIERLILCYDFHQNIDPFVAGLLDFALDFQQKKGSHFQGFIHWMHEKGLRKTIGMPENIEAVKLLTIHTSKGLQFPTVFIPNFNKSAPRNNTYHWVETEELIPELPTASIKQQAALKESSFSDVITEEIDKTELDVFNLLYVAITRPEFNVYLWSDMDDKSGVFDSYLSAITTHEHWNNETKKLAIGSPFILSSDKKTSNTITLQNFNYSQWDKLENISFSAPEQWEYQSLFEKTTLGTMYHEILAHINDKADISSAIEKMKAKFDLTDEQIPEIQHNLNGLLELPELQPWFGHDVKAMNEQAILTKDGNVLRPDRVVIFPNETIILDYKTGHFMPSYLKQLNNYANALYELGYKNIKKYLVYLETKEIVKYD